MVSAVEGVEVQTAHMWKVAANLGLPRLIFVNKLDRERASFERTLEDLQAAFGAGVAPLELPIGEEAAFRGVADLLSDTAITYEGGRPTTGPIPDDMAGREHSVHDALVEGIVVADDDLMERYLEGEVPTVKQLEETLGHGVASATVFPVVCGSATKEIAVDRLASFICEIGPSPLDRPPVTVEAGGKTAEVAPDPSGPPLAWVWKTVVDRHVGKISLFKVLSGRVKPDDTLVNARTHSDERIHAPFTLRGKEQLQVPELPVGDLGAVAKLADVVTGDTLAPKGTPVVIPPRPVPEPALRVGIRPKSKGDEDKLMTALHRLQEEDPALSVLPRRRDPSDPSRRDGRDPPGHRDRAAGPQVRRRGRDRAGRRPLPGDRSPARPKPRASTRSRPAATASSGWPSCASSPMERGEGFEFVDQIVGGAIPRQFIPAVQKGIEEAMAGGGTHGWPVVDVRVTCFDGKYHSVDSSEMSFKMAGAIGFREAMEKAAPILLEPISRIEVNVPTAYQGDVMGDLNGRRGRVQGTEAGNDGESIITALVPTSEILRYAIDLRSMTGGRGHFHAEHDHYDPLPHNLWDHVSRDHNGN